MNPLCPAVCFWIVLAGVGRLVGPVVWLAIDSFSSACESAVWALCVLFAPLTTGLMVGARLHADDPFTPGWKAAMVAAMLGDVLLNMAPGMAADATADATAAATAAARPSGVDGRSSSLRRAAVGRRSSRRAGRPLPGSGRCGRGFRPGASRQGCGPGPRTPRRSGSGPSARPRTAGRAPATP